MPNIDVALIVGSLRRESLNRKMARALVGLAPPGMTLSSVEIGDLPHYNEDLEAAPPPAFTRFRAAIAAADAVLFVTPEFNRSMPGALKNAVDVGSRPWGKSIWNGKPAAVMSVSPGALGGFGANHHLRQALMAVNVAVMPHPEAYIGGAAAMFDAAGDLIDANTREFAAGFLRSFQIWIEQQRKGL
jgi:chromate reductase, NAD(P)H dehydrogenase (quinone)